MSHMIVSGIDHVISPAENSFSAMWHGKEEHPEGGAIALDGSNAEICLRHIHEVGLKPDFDSPLTTITGDDDAENETENVLSTHKALIADLRPDGKGCKMVGCHKKSYKTHQNRTLFEAMVVALIEVFGGVNGFEIVTVGTLGAYSQFFMSILIKGLSAFTIGSGDEHKVFVNLNSSHNGLIGSNYLASIIRAVCMNTIMASINDAVSRGTISKVKHTINSLELITPTAMAKVIAQWEAMINMHKAALKAMLATPMSQDDFRAFATGVFTLPTSDKLSGTSRNRVDDMVQLFVRGKGNQGKTLYDGYNAFTEFFTTGRGVGGFDVKKEKKIASANFGRGNEWKLEALRVASNEETLRDTMKRGERLYSECLLS